MKILIVVSTCPRPDGVNYLEKTLDSLEASGATSFPRLVLSDGPCKLRRPGWELKADPRGPRSVRHNLWGSFKEALASGAEMLLYFEDDIVACKNAVLAMAKTHVPDEVAFVTFHDLNGRASGQQKLIVRPAKDTFWGCQALSIPRRTLDYLVTCDPFEGVGERANSGDKALVKFIQSSPTPAFALHKPSLFKHLGEVSVAHPRETMRPGRITVDYAGDDYDALA